MNKEQITKEWVKANFDLDAERTSKVKHEWIDFTKSLPYTGFQELGVWLKEIQKQLKSFKQEKGCTNAKIVVEKRYACDEFSDESVGFSIEYVQFESDAQVVARIIRREKAKITRKNTEKKKVDKEYQKYLELKAKYEGNEK